MKLAPCIHAESGRHQFVTLEAAFQLQLVLVDGIGNKPLRLPRSVSTQTQRRAIAAAVPGILVRLQPHTGARQVPPTCPTCVEADGSTLSQ